jgi:amidohydrolase
MPESFAPEEVRRAAVARIDASRPLVEEIAVALYRKPELGLAETFASGLLASRLEADGFAVERGLAGLPTAFRARWGSGRPALAFLAEYDALPAVGHGCGHNLIAACSTAAVLACKAAAPAGWSGRLELIGTPAEESLGGKVVMADGGVFADLDAAFIAHPGQRNILGGTSWASHPIEITCRGRSAHAGGNPQAGINALDALVHAYLQIRNLRNSLREDVRLAGIITQGGDAQNVVPDVAQARFTVRARDWRYLEEVVLPRVRQAAEGAAHAVGAGVEFRHHESLFPETLEHPILAEIARRNFDALGVPLSPPPPGGGVTDVGSVTWVIPCIQIGYAMSEARGHSRELADDTVTARAIDATLAAAKVLALSALDLAWSPARLAEAQAYLAQAKAGQR